MDILAISLLQLIGITVALDNGVGKLPKLGYDSKYKDFGVAIEDWTH